MIFTILILAFSILLLNYSSEKVLKYLILIAQYLNWREFVTSFILVSLASSLPNLWTGIIAASKNISLLSFGDIVGNNIVVLSLGIGLSSLFSLKGIPTKSRTINTTSLFTLFTSLLILLLMIDKKLSRIDGIALFLSFVFYLIWLFSKKERFTLNNNKETKQNNSTVLNSIEIKKELKQEVNKFIVFLKYLGNCFLNFLLISLAGYGVVYSAQKIAYYFSFPLMFLGMIITGVGNALPEISVAITSARKNQEWLILGNLLGSVFMLNALILSIVILINPIIFDSNNFLSAFFLRFFISFLVLIFYLFSLTDGLLTKKEGLVLMIFYILFLYFIISNIFSL